ncbi:MAG: alpha/beta hydrolase [Campylobacterota bacterium]|nr:alpha/beta hydrolase [Campylobacterota bacterium]
MKKFIYSLLVIIIAISLSGCALSKEDIAKIKQNCSSQGEDFIYHEGECLETKYIDGTKKGIINIIFHGGSNGAKDTLSMIQGFAADLAQKTGYKTYYYARPTYGKSSQNVWYKVKKNFQEIDEKYIQYNSRFVKKLLSKENATKANLIAFSAGTTVSANIATLTPNIVNKVILIGGQYDFYKQQVIAAEAYGGCADCKKNNLRKAIAGGFIPIKNVDMINKDLKFFIIAGDKDRLCPKSLSEEYVDELKEYKIKHKYLLYKQDGKFYNPEAGHKALFFEPNIWDATSKFINE